MAFIAVRSVFIYIKKILFICYLYAFYINKMVWI